MHRLILTALLIISLVTASSRWSTHVVEVDDKPKCVVAKECYEDDQCNGGKCIGLNHGKCDCNACIEYVSCASDRDCGGLEGACKTEAVPGVHLKIRRCDCNDAFAQHGYEAFANVLPRRSQEICERSCYGSYWGCYGLPCIKGMCIC